MNRTLLLTLLLCLAETLSAGKHPNVIKVKAGDAESLLAALEKANELNADTMSERLYVLIPNGTYDLGERVLTTIGGHNITLVGESMEECAPCRERGYQHHGHAAEPWLKHLRAGSDAAERLRLLQLRSRRSCRLLAGQGFSHHLQACAHAVLSGYLLQSQ